MVLRVLQQITAYCTESGHSFKEVENEIGRIEAFEESKAIMEANREIFERVGLALDEQIFDQPELKAINTSELYGLIRANNISINDFKRHFSSIKLLAKPQKNLRKRIEQTLKGLALLEDADVYDVSIELKVMQELTKDAFISEVLGVELSYIEDAEYIIDIMDALQNSKNMLNSDHGVRYSDKISKFSAERKDEYIESFKQFLIENEIDTFKKFLDLDIKRFDLRLSSLQDLNSLFGIKGRQKEVINALRIWKIVKPSFVLEETLVDYFKEQAKNSGKDPLHILMQPTDCIGKAEICGVSLNKIGAVLYPEWKNNNKGNVRKLVCLLFDIDFDLESNRIKNNIRIYVKQQNIASLREFLDHDYSELDVLNGDIRNMRYFESRFWQTVPAYRNLWTLYKPVDALSQHDDLIDFYRNEAKKANINLMFLLMRSVGEYSRICIGEGLNAKSFSAVAKMLFPDLKGGENQCRKTVEVLFEVDSKAEIENFLNSVKEYIIKNNIDSLAKFRMHRFEIEGLRDVRDLIYLFNDLKRCDNRNRLTYERVWNKLNEIYDLF